MNNPRQLEHFVQNVEKMRQLQKEYFDTRNRSVLAECKRMEFLVDRQTQKAINYARTLVESEA